MTYENKNKGRASPAAQDHALSPSGTEPVPVSSADAVTIVDAELDGIAAEMDPYICKMSDRPFTGGLLRQALKYDEDIRSVAVASLDAYHGFTCEFSPWPRQHVSEYDMLEELLAQAKLAKARGQ